MGAVDVDAAVRFIARCKNFDGGFGATPGEERPAESPHAHDRHAVLAT